MKLDLGAPFTIYANPAPLLVSRHAVFPGLAHPGGADLVALFAVGQAFDAADMRIEVSHSADLGATWSAPVPLHQDRSRLESESFKPVLLPDGRLMATGYVFLRPDMLTPIVDPHSLALLPLRNRVSWSDDGGQTWTVPRDFDVEGAPLELSGPPIVCHDGRLLAVAAPFHLGATGHEGWLIESRDRGESWQRLSVFYRAAGGNIAPWEARLAELAPGQIAVIFWAYDTAAGVNLDNHLVVSQDGGASFGPAIASGIMGQASNIMALGRDRALTLHAHRAAPVGLILREIDLAAGLRILSENEIPLTPVSAAASDGIAAQFGSLKFGQPSLLRVADDLALAAWWQYEEGQHVIKGLRVGLRSG